MPFSLERTKWLYFGWSCTTPTLQNYNEIWMESEYKIHEHGIWIQTISDTDYKPLADFFITFVTTKTQSSHQRPDYSLGHAKGNGIQNNIFDMQAFTKFSASLYLSLIYAVAYQFFSAQIHMKLNQQALDTCCHFLSPIVIQIVFISIFHTHNTNW